MSLIILYGRIERSRLSFRRSATKLSIRDIRTIISDRNHRLRITLPPLSLSLCVSTQSKYKVRKGICAPLRGIYFSRSHPILVSSSLSFSRSLRFAWTRPETFTSTSFYRIRDDLSPVCVCARACVCLCASNFSFRLLQKFTRCLLRNNSS